MGAVPPSPGCVGGSRPDFSVMGPPRSRGRARLWPPPPTAAPGVPPPSVPPGRRRAPTGPGERKAAGAPCAPGGESPRGSRTPVRMPRGPGSGPLPASRCRHLPLAPFPSQVGPDPSARRGLPRTDGAVPGTAWGPEAEPERRCPEGVGGVCARPGPGGLPAPPCPSPGDSVRENQVPGKFHSGKSRVLGHDSVAQGPAEPGRLFQRPGTARPLASPPRLTPCGSVCPREEGVEGQHLSRTGPCPAPGSPPRPPQPRAPRRPPPLGALSPPLPRRAGAETPGAAEPPGERPPCRPPCLLQPLPLIKRALLFFQPTCPFSERCPRRVTQAAGPWHGGATPSAASPDGAARGDGGCPGSGEPRAGLRPLPSARPSPRFEFLATELNKSGCCKLN